MVRRADTAGCTTVSSSFCSHTPATRRGGDRDYGAGPVTNSNCAPNADSGSVIWGTAKTGPNSSRLRQGVGKPFFEGLSLPNLGLVRQDNERQVHVTSRCDCDGCPPCLQQALLAISWVSQTPGRPRAKDSPQISLFEKARQTYERVRRDKAQEYFSRCGDLSKLLF